MASARRRHPGEMGAERRPAAGEEDLARGHPAAEDGDPVDRGRRRPGRALGIEGDGDGIAFGLGEPAGDAGAGGIGDPAQHVLGGDPAGAVDRAEQPAALHRGVERGALGAGQRRRRGGAGGGGARRRRGGRRRGRGRAPAAARPGAG